MKKCKKFGENTISTVVDGWEEDFSKAKNLADLPYNVRSYLEMIENEVEVPVCIASIGPERSQTISIVDFWN